MTQRCKGPGTAELNRRISDLEREVVTVRVQRNAEKQRAEALHTFIYHQAKATAAMADMFSIARQVCGDFDDDLPF